MNSGLGPFTREPLRAFGIELKPLDEADLPIVCHWRNSPEIRRHMGDTRLVTPKVLHFWLNKSRLRGDHLPWIVLWDGAPAGFTELKNIERTASACEDGIFLFGQEHMGKGLGRRIMLCREIVMLALGIDVFSNSIRISNGRSLAFYGKYGPRLLKTSGDLRFFSYAPGERRAALERQAAALDLAEEYASRIK